MARISVIEREKKKAIMDELIYQLFLAEGWDAVTYDRLSKELDMRKSTIQSYYEKSIMFATALQGRVFPLVIQKLDFSTKEAFLSSWANAYSDPDSHIFRETVRMLLLNIVKPGTSPISRGAVVRLEKMLSESIGDQEANLTIKEALGTTLYYQMTT
ncbi:TetR/AcrR family transcriptional regulator [Photobacterium damselae]|uniref:TetR/AcrR family transcriptional regulator n=1 Tax=Photobacterium damselae TaxID=38293 RepID=UPI0010FD4A84|nr:TetR/AcrR family transcriptional regulator [Photobacterium damselae]MCG3816103.1 TetR/AcrR family transcriptional regulator [Photobacterium damselae]TLS79214.1 TetR/AcrR family transcriptional regulator [Photobacterium damselae subsp. damselae]TLS82918.1 TetR/AcrR family transcriptional regulator [Photobacterium damselae subsp. damselae]